MATVTSMTATAIQAKLDLKADVATTLIKNSNLSDVQDKAAARTNLNLAQRLGVDVRDYQAVGDGITNDTLAIQNALDAAPPGSTVYLSGTHYVTAPLIIPPQVRLAGMNATTLDPSAKPSLVPGGTFSGAAVILLVDQTTGGYSRTSNEQHITNLSIDFGQVPGTTILDGIQVQGFVPGGVLENVSINEPTGYGVNFVGNASGTASSWRCVRVVVVGPVNYGINATINDSTWIDCEVKSGAANGWQVGNAVNSTFVGCRADNNAGNGYYFDSGASGNYVGGQLFVSCSTNRNGQNGVLIPSAANGKAPISFVGCRFQRDGSTSTSSGYAGININGSTHPITLTGCQTSPGVDSSGSGNNSPQYGLSVTSGNVRVNGGVWHAVTEGIHDGGSNAHFKRGIDVLERTGTIGAPVDVVRGVQTTDTNNGSLDVPGNLAGVPMPSAHGFVAWTSDPGVSNGGTIQPAGGSLQLGVLYIPKKFTATKLWWYVSSAAVTPTSGQNFIAIYDSSGNLVTSVNIDTATTTTGVKTTTISSALVPGKYWVAFLCNASTRPSMYNTSAGSLAFANINLTASTSRYGLYGSSLTAMPSTLTLASISTWSNCVWTAIS